MKKSPIIDITPLMNPDKPKFRISIYWKGETYCQVFGKNKEEVDARADEIIQGIKLLSIQSNEELELDLVNTVKNLIFEFDGMWELFDISGKEVPNAVQAIKNGKELLKRIEKLTNK